MPFIIDATWPDRLLTLFREDGQIKSQYHLPYNTMLHYCFAEPDDFELIIEPQLIDTEGNIDFIVHHFDATTLQTYPVFFLELNADATTTAYDADQRIRKRLKAAVRECKAPRLWALSTFGTSIRIYQCDVAANEISPPPPTVEPERAFPNKFLEQCWAIDIHSQRGFDEMKVIVADIQSSIPGRRSLMQADLMKVERVFGFLPIITRPLRKFWYLMWYLIW